MKKMKPEKYLGKTIKFVTAHRFRTVYGMAGARRVEAYVDNIFIAKGSTKAIALKEAKAVLDWRKERESKGLKHM